MGRRLRAWGKTSEPSSCRPKLRTRNETRPKRGRKADLGRTRAAWHTEILAHHRTGASNGPTMGLNLCVNEVKAAVTGSVASPTTSYECSSTPAVSPGPPDHQPPPHPKPHSQ